MTSGISDGVTDDQWNEGWSNRLPGASVLELLVTWSLSDGVIDGRLSGYKY